MDKMSSLSLGQRGNNGEWTSPGHCLSPALSILASFSKQPCHFILKGHKDQRGQGHTADIPSLWLNMEFLTPKAIFITSYLQFIKDKAYTNNKINIYV